MTKEQLHKFCRTHNFIKNKIKTIYIKDVSPRKKLYEIKFDNKVVGNIESTYFSEPNFIIYDLVIDYILDNDKILKRIKKIIDRIEAIPRLTAELEVREKEALETINEKLQECFEGFDYDNNLETTFEVEFSQFRSWKSHNENHYAEANPINIDTMFEAFKLKIRSKVIGANIFYRNVFSSIDEIKTLFKTNNILYEKFIDNVAFTIDYMKVTIDNNNFVYFHGEEVDEPIRYMEASLFCTSIN